MTDALIKQIEECVQRINALWENEVSDSEHERSASDAAANLMSGSGVLNAPLEVLRMLTQAIEVGYAAALKDVEEGAYDGAIRYAWRTELFE